MTETKRVALTLGIMFAIFHTIGVLLLQTGIASYAKWAHLIDFQYTIQPFSIVPFIAGIITAFIVGYVIGWLFVTIYSKVK